MGNDIRIKQEFIYNFADCIADYKYTLAENILYIADRIKMKTLDQDILKIVQNYKKKLVQESVAGEEEYFDLL